MPHKRWKLQSALCQYVTDTLTYIVAVRDFCETFSGWKDCREKEVEKMRNIKERVDIIDPSFSKSENKQSSFLKHMKSKFQINTDSKLAVLEEELGEVLKDTLEGLEKLSTFLDAVEKLAVTSLQVFTQNQILFMPEEISFDDVQALIKSARLICPLLLEFKRDAKKFFVPKRHNVEVLLYQLEKHQNTSEKVFENLADRYIHLQQEITKNSWSCYEAHVHVAVECDLSDDDMQNMTDHIKELNKIRMDEHFRMAFLFQRISYSTFVNNYNNELPQMLQFLDEIEKCAVQLDRMNTGAKISSVAGSSVGVVGGVLSIVGLALIPVTAGVSFGLTIAGMSLGVTSGVNSLVTTAVEIGVNHKQNNQANTAFQKFMFGVQRIQDCLEEVAKPPHAEVTQSSEHVAYMAGKIAFKSLAVRRTVDFIADAVTACKAFKSNEMVANAGKVVLQEGKALRTASVASDVPDIGQAALKGPLALSKGARAGFIAANALFVGMDIFFITKDSMALAKGTETKVSKFLRARAELWRSEIEAWEKICNSLCHSKLTAEENREMLEKPVYS